MSKQSSLDWLIDQVHSEKYQNAFGPTYISLALIVEAEQMHKEEIEDAWNNGMKSDNGHFGTSEQYYQKTYGGSPETSDN